MSDEVTSAEVAVLGLGIMGAGMARSLVRDGHRVRLWNRTHEKAVTLAEETGATAYDDAAAAVEGAEVVVLALFDGDAVAQVLEAIADAAADAVVLQTSTIGPARMREIGVRAADAGVAILDAPVLGTKKPAEEGQLTVLLSGEEALRPRVEAVTAAIGARSLWVGAALGEASALKLACNSWIGSITAAAAQALAIARGSGLDPALVLEAISGSAVDTPYLQVKGRAIIEGDFTPSFALDGVIKDLGLIAEQAAATGMPTELLDSTRNAFRRASSAGAGAEDMAAVVRAFERPS